MMMHRVVNTVTTTSGSSRTFVVATARQLRHISHIHVNSTPQLASTSSNNGNSTKVSKRWSSTYNNNNSTNIAFDRKIKRLQRDGAARAHILHHHHQNNSNNTNTNSNSNTEEVINYDYFREEIANRLVDRLEDIVREEGFPLALDVGSGPGFLHRAICNTDPYDLDMDMDTNLDSDGDDSSSNNSNNSNVGGIGGVRKLVQMDSSALMLHRDDDNDSSSTTTKAPPCGTYKLHHDEELPLPFPSQTFDLILSSTSLHAVNSLPSLFREILRTLKPDGCFLLAMVGSNTTLQELRSSLVLGEMERDGGVSTHLGPFVDVNDVGTLLGEAGFTLTTVDVDTITVGYPNMMVLMEHLQRMGEGNAAVYRKGSVGRDTFLASACLYDEMFPLEDGGGVEASVQVIYAIGWSPHESQQKPKERGSATHKVGDIIVDKSTSTSTSASTTPEQ